MWVSVPRKLPYRCHATAQGEEKHGPFFEGFTFTYPGDDRELTFYGSRAWVESVLRTPGSPFACITQEEFARMEAERDILQMRLEELEEKLTEAEMEADELRNATKPVTARQIAEEVVDLIGRPPPPVKPNPRRKAA